MFHLLEDGFDVVLIEECSVHRLETLFKWLGLYIFFFTCFLTHVSACPLAISNRLTSSPVLSLLTNLPFFVDRSLAISGSAATAPTLANDINYRTFILFFELGRSESIFPKTFSSSRHSRRVF